MRCGRSSACLRNRYFGAPLCGLMLRSGAAPFVALKLSNSLALRRVSKHGSTPRPNHKIYGPSLFPCCRRRFESAGSRAKSPRNQRFFLCTRPTLYLPFSRNRISHPIKPLRKYQGDWSTLGRITAERSGIMFGHSPFQAGTCCSYVIAGIRTLQDIKGRTVYHSPTSLHQSVECARPPASLPGGIC